jgi:hypothetical protein
MKTLLVVALVIVSLVGAVAGFYFYDQIRMSPGAGSTSSSTCSDPASISSHIYNPYRLQIVKPCITASGIVDRVIDEADGDVHLRLNLDQTYSNLTNSGNDGYPNYGDLVVDTRMPELYKPDSGSERWPAHHDHWPICSRF